MASLIAVDSYYQAKQALKDMPMLRLTNVELQMAKAVAKMRKEASKGPNTRTFVPDNDVTGACGEIAFANWMSVPWDWRNKPQGDDGIDFVIGDYTIDVKSTKGGPDRRLMVVEGQVKAAIYVLVLRSPVDPSVVALAGWERQDKIIATPPEKWKKFVFPNHMIPAVELQPMEELRFVLDPLWDGGVFFSINEGCSDYF